MTVTPRLCECGCGRPTRPAPKTSKRDGWKKGQPQRFIHGHNKIPASTPAPVKPCECGCGRPAPIAKETDRRTGTVKGQPTRYIRGHNPSGRPQKHLTPVLVPAATRPCECGCGQPAPIAKRDDRSRGNVRGHPQRFIRGHAGGVQPHAYAEELIHRSELLVGAVHDDGPDELLAHLTGALRLKPPPGVDPVVALVTVLAAQIDPDTTAEQRLGWVRAFDPHEPPGPLPVRASPRKETAA